MTDDLGKKLFVGQEPWRPWRDLVWYSISSHKIDLPPILSLKDRATISMGEPLLETLIKGTQGELNEK